MRVRFDDCLLDSETRQLFVRGTEAHLQPKAFQLLELLIQNRPRVVLKEEIQEKLWPGTFISEGTLTSLLAEVREAIGDDARQPRFVRTAHRVGYAFSGDAHEVRDRPAPTRESGPAVWLVKGKLRIPLDAGESIIGRDPGATVHLDDASVSRRHARIIVAPEGATLEDLDSKNGTFLGKTRVRSPLALSDRDAIRIGSVPLLVRVFASPASTLTNVETKP
jgi:DNA-binding winged helix-turn-helix (wHTH) protein